MPGPIAPALIPVLAGLGGQAMNAASQKDMNNKQLIYNEYLYKKQRRDALADWNMQNAYDSPQAQMKRLKEAGLNPNLVYGSGVTQNAGPIRSTDSQSWRPEAPQFDLQSAVSGGLASYYDLQMKQAQIDNVKAATTLSGLQAVVVANQGDTGKFDLEQKQALANTSQQVAKAQLDKILTENAVLFNRDQREEFKMAQDYKESAERILTMQLQRAKTQDERNEINQRIKNLSSDQKLKELDIELKKRGLQPGDPLYMRAIAQYLGADLDAAINEVKNRLQKKPGTKR